MSVRGRLSKSEKREQREIVSEKETYTQRERRERKRERARESDREEGMTILVTGGVCGVKIMGRTVLLQDVRQYPNFWVDKRAGQPALA